MRILPMTSPAQNHIHLGNGAGITDTECVSFNGLDFFQARMVRPGVYLVQGDVPSDATEVRVGLVASTDQGTRFLTDDEVGQRVVDAQREEQLRQVRTVSSEQVLFQVLDDTELTALLASTDPEVRKGLLRLMVARQTTSTEPWFQDFVRQLGDRNILTNARAAAVTRLDAPIVPDESRPAGPPRPPTGRQQPSAGG